MNYKLAFALGLIPPGVVGREPVAYLYNGVRLPKAPVVPGYEYSMLWQFASSYTMSVSNKPFVIRDSLVVTDGDSLQCFPPVGSIKEWTVSEHPHDSVHMTSAVWSDHDIANEDGTIYLEASAPVPVYE